MIGRQLTRVGQNVRRTITTSAPRQHGHEPYGVIGANLPMNIENPWTLAIKFAIFAGTGFSIPFIAVRKNLKRQCTPTE